jgi:hypothetical protein
MNKEFTIPSECRRESGQREAKQNLKTEGMILKIISNEMTP